MKSLSAAVLAVVLAAVGTTAWAQVISSSPQPAPAAPQTIDQLPAATAPLTDTDLLMFEPGGKPPAKSVTLGALKAYLGTGGGPPVQPPETINPNAFYLAPNGKDTNSGSIDAPFATFAKAQAAMRSSTTKKTTYVRAGNYRPPSTGNSYGATAAIVFGDADNGTTWSYYPPDGYASAKIDGGSTRGGTGVYQMFAGGGTAAVTVTGLEIHHFEQAAFQVDVKLTATHNTIHDMYTNNPIGGISFAVGAGNHAVGSLVDSNYIYNQTSRGVSMNSQSNQGGLNNVVVSNNMIENTCTTNADCGAIYFIDAISTGNSTNVQFKNNYVRDVDPNSNGVGGRGIYLDDGTSNVTSTGNVLSGKMNAGIQIHGGQNNKFEGNLLDLASTKSIVFYQTSGVRTPMTGNTFKSNIVIMGASGGGDGFVGDGSPPSPLVISNNSYHNYVGAAIKTTGSGGAGSDASPVHQNPLLDCWTYELPPNSPVHGMPIGFPPMQREWGPAGFTITHTGTPPSSPHNC